MTIQTSFGAILSCENSQINLYKVVLTFLSVDGILKYFGVELLIIVQSDSNWLRPLVD